MGTSGTFANCPNASLLHYFWDRSRKMGKNGFFSHFGQLLQWNLVEIVNFGQNEQWACPVASKLSQRRPLTFFHQAAHKKLKKRVLFAFRPITPMQNFLRGIQGMPSESWRPGLSENVVVFVAIIFFNLSYGFSKSTESESLAMAAKIRKRTKK